MHPTSRDPTASPTIIVDSQRWLYNPLFDCQHPRRGYPSYLQLLLNGQHLLDRRLRIAASLLRGTEMATVVV
jgi:hypothetical protein